MHLIDFSFVAYIKYKVLLKVLIIVKVFSIGELQNESFVILENKIKLSGSILYIKLKSFSVLSFKHNFIS